jgi:hypothetical protein
LTRIVAGLALQIHVIIVIFLEADALAESEAATRGTAEAGGWIAAGLAGVAAGLADLDAVIVVSDRAVAEISDVIYDAMSDCKVTSCAVEDVGAGLADIVAGLAG